MKKLIVFCALLLPLFSLAQNDDLENPAAASSDQLAEKIGLDEANKSETPYTGPVRDVYPNGQKKLEASFVNGHLDGVMLAWYENGQKQAESNFAKGRREGPMTLWHANGRKKAHGSWVSGKLNGPWTVWHDNGQRKFEGTYRNGKLLFGAKWWDENGQTVIRPDHIS